MRTKRKPSTGKKEKKKILQLSVGLARYAGKYRRYYNIAPMGVVCAISLNLAAWLKFAGIREAELADYMYHIGDLLMKMKVKKEWAVKV